MNSASSERYHHYPNHTFGTRWLQAGGDIYKLSKILGHSSVAVTDALRTDAFTRVTVWKGRAGREAWERSRETGRT